MASCGGGGTSQSPSSTSATTAPSATIYAHSLTVGVSVPQSITYTAATGQSQATLTTSGTSLLLEPGATDVLAEHVEPALAGLRVACISGRGDTVNVITNINLGVVAESAAVLLDDRWSVVDALTAWSETVAAGEAWLGWENCGVKPEGLPSPSSRLVPTPTGGYAEDVYDGNPSTTFQAIRRNVSAAEVTAMLSPAGQGDSSDLQRPMLLLLRAYEDGAGHRIFVQTGTPAPGASGSVRGFIALYVPSA